MKIILFLLSLPLAAQTLMLSCPPRKPNQATVCPISFTGGGATDLQWHLTSTPKVNLVVAAVPATGKSIVSNGDIYLLTSMNATPLAGKVATITLPALPPHGPSIRLSLSDAIGVDLKGHAVTVKSAIIVQIN